MTTIAEQLQYLNESKELLALAIQEKGGVLPGPDGLVNQLEEIKQLVLDDYINRGKVPSLKGDEAYDKVQLVKYLTRLTAPFDEIGFSYGVDQMEVTSGENMTGKHAYSPTQNRIYILPDDVDIWSNYSTQWSYVDCNTGEIIWYNHGLTVEMFDTEEAVHFQVLDMVYCSKLDRIYLSVPLTVGYIPYIDCTKNDNNVVVVPHGIVPVEVDEDAGYSEENPPPMEVMLPYVEYMTAVNNQYIMTYCPTNNMIYLTTMDYKNWCVLDCQTGLIEVKEVFWFGDLTAAPGPMSPMHVAGMFQQMGVYGFLKDKVKDVCSTLFGKPVYSPTQNRIYLIPFIFDYEYLPKNWYYIDCSTNEMVAYEHNLSLTDVTFSSEEWLEAGPFKGIKDMYPITRIQTGVMSGDIANAVYSIHQNRIYLLPCGLSHNENWIYIDCNDGTVKTYTPDGKNTIGIDFVGGSYSPITDRIYLSTNTMLAEMYGAPMPTPEQLGDEVAFPPSSLSGILAFKEQPFCNYYLDCKTNKLVNTPFTSMGQSYSATGNTMQSIYSPTQNRIYNLINDNGVSYIQEFGNIQINPKIIK